MELWRVGKGWSFEGGVRGKRSFEEGGGEREDGMCMRVIEGGVGGKGSFEAGDEREDGGGGGGRTLEEWVKEWSLGGRERVEL